MNNYMNSKKKLADDIRELKGLSLIFSILAFFLGWIFLSLFNGIEGINDGKYLCLVIVYLVIIHLSSIVFLPETVMRKDPRKAARLKGTWLTPIMVIYALAGAVVYTMINNVSYSQWGGFRTFIFGLACFALNYFIANASSVWIWVNYNIPVFLLWLAFTTVCNYLILHAIASSIIFIFFCIICMGGLSSMETNGDHTSADMDRMFEDYCIIMSASEWADGRWML